MENPATESPGFVSYCLFTGSVLCNSQPSPCSTGRSYTIEKANRSWKKKLKVVIVRLGLFLIPYLHRRRKLVRRLFWNEWNWRIRRLTTSKRHRQLLLFYCPFFHNFIFGQIHEFGNSSSGEPSERYKIVLNGNIWLVNLSRLPCGDVWPIKTWSATSIISWLCMLATSIVTYFTFSMNGLMTSNNLFSITCFNSDSRFLFSCCFLHRQRSWVCPPTSGWWGATARRLLVELNHQP